jgi:hypothetical protein
MGWFKKKDEPKRQPQLMAGQNDYVFRRSRTLTGSVSPELAVTAERRGQLKTDRLKAHELRAHMGYVLRIFAGVIAVCFLLSFLVVNFIFDPGITVGQAGRGKPDATVYKQSTFAYFADHPLERFGFLLKGTDLENFLRARHSELASVTVDHDWYGGNVRLSLFFRKPLLTWKVAGDQFYVDGQGTAFKYNFFSEPQVSITDQSGLPTDGSGVIASSRFIHFLGRMVGALGSYGPKYKVVEVIVPRSTREIDLKLQGRDYIVKTNSDREPLQQAEDVVNALAYLDSHGLRPSYVDLRVAHKAFYK